MSTTGVIDNIKGLHSRLKWASSRPWYCACQLTGTPNGIESSLTKFVSAVLFLQAVRNVYGNLDPFTFFLFFLVILSTKVNQPKLNLAVEIGLISWVSFWIYYLISHTWSYVGLLPGHHTGNKHDQNEHTHLIWLTEILQCSFVQKLLSPIFFSRKVRFKAPV